MKNTLSIYRLMAMSLLAGLMAEAHSAEAKILQVVNPARTIGIQIGDVLSRTIEIEVEKPYQLSKSALPAKGTRQQDVELVDIKLESTDHGKLTRYKVGLSYQVFAYSASPSVMRLPSETFMLSGGPQGISASMPAWKFWYSPLVTGDVSTAQKNIQPQHAPRLLDTRAHQIRLAVFASLILLALAGLVYVNADRRWLPFMGGEFANAHRKIKRLPKDQSGVRKGLLYLHQAFNRIYGANLFVGDVNKFLEEHPRFSKAKAQIEAFFEKSNQSLFSEQQLRDGQSVMDELVSLSRNLRDYERGVR